MATWVTGNKVHLTCTFTDSNNNLVDPASVSLKYRDPVNGVVTQTYNPGNIVRISIGLYAYDYDSTGVTGPVPYEWVVPPGVGQSAVPGLMIFTPLPV